MLTVRIGDLNHPTGALKCVTENKDWGELRSFLETGAKKGNGESITTTKLDFDPTSDPILKDASWCAVRESNPDLNVGNVQTKDKKKFKKKRQKKKNKKK